jgi:acetate kinase
MVILAINAGSSSVRLGLYLPEGEPLLRVCTPHGDFTPSIVETLRRFIDPHPITAVVHRIVHGGTLSAPATLIDPSIERAIEDAASLAPLHNPVALNWVHACRDLFGKTMPQVAVFDTALYAHLPDVAATYALPKALLERHGIRRYGFHGLAHSDMLRAWRNSRVDLPDGGRLITLQLGAGCSVTAFNRGQAQDTSMGFSPLEGLVMATRSGDVDAGVLLHLQRHAHLSPDRLDALLNKESGLLGVSGQSGDMRALLASSDPRAKLAIDMFCYRARKYIGAYTTVLGGLDGIVFGGGIGENSPAIRAQILHGLEWTGLILDADVNDRTLGTEKTISDAESKISVRVVPVNEMAILAAAARTVLSSDKAAKEAIA